MQQTHDSLTTEIVEVEGNLVDNDPGFVDRDKAKIFGCDPTRPLLQKDFKKSP